MSQGANLNNSSPITLRWFIWGRVCFLSLALVSALFTSFFYGSEGETKSGFLFVPILFFITFSALSAKWYRPGILFNYVQLFADVIIVTGAIYSTGGAISPFLFLYLTPVMAAALVLSRRSALVVSAISTGAYSLMMGSLLKGWILTSTGEIFNDYPAGGLLLQIIGLSSAMILVAVCTSYLGGKLRISTALVEQSKLDLLDLHRKQQTIVEGMPEGIITSGLDSTISNINQTALDILSVSYHEAHGRPIDEVFRDAGMVLPKQDDDLPHEFEFTSKGSGTKRSLVYHSRTILDGTGGTTGRVYILQDITKLREVENKLEIQEQMARLLSNKNTSSVSSNSKIRNFVGESPVMKKVFNLIDRVAPSDATVLISGESGTGKELVARAIHLGSGRGNNPFVPVNCGAIPENLIESELFGHKRGAFTGAETDHHGLFRQAEGGTIFLDEIGELPVHMQTKLLRAIQQKSVRPVGGERDIPINVRIVAATNRTLKREIELGNFREDLFYRLNVININLPPLRDRKDDLPLLINSTLKRLVKNEATPVIPPATMSLLLSYTYPGNVRELENILERALVLGGEVILPEHLPDSIRVPAEAAQLSTRPGNTEIIIDENIEFPIKLDDLLGGIEKRYLEVALVKTNGARKKAADLLGMNFRSFRYRLEKFGIGDGSDEA